MTARPPATSLALARTFLFVPGDRPERYAKALATNTDVVIIDLEDAVSAAAKDRARSMLHDNWGSFSMADRRRLVIRINAANSAWHAADLELLKALSRQELAGIMVPKTDGAGPLTAITDECGDVALLPLVETAAAFGALDEIACAPHVVRLCLGSVDLQADLSMEAGDDGMELAAAKWSIAVASRRASRGLPVDGVTLSIDKPEQLMADTQRAIRAGFGAKLCIHPSQIDVVHAAMTPSPQKLEWALKVIEQAASGVGALQVDGKMVDEPVLRLAERFLARS